MTPRERTALMTRTKRNAKKLRRKPMLASRVEKEKELYLELLFIYHIGKIFNLKGCVRCNCLHLLDCKQFML